MTITPPVFALFLKATALWMLILLAAIGNGVLRQQLLEPALGRTLALSLSGVLLSLIIFGLSWLLVPILGRVTNHSWYGVGLLWVALTLMFEYLFGYYLAGHSLQTIHGTLDLTDGNLFLLALLVAGASPRLAAGLHGLVD